MHSRLLLLAAIVIFVTSPRAQAEAPTPALARPGKLLVDDDFTTVRDKKWMKLAGDWQVRAGLGEWKQRDGFYRSDWHPGGGHTPVMAYRGACRDVIVECTFRYGKRTEAYHDQCFRIALDNRDAYTGHVVSAWANRNNNFIDRGFLLQHIHKTPEKVTLKDLRLDKQHLHVDPDVWYTALLEVVGDEVLFRLGDDHIAYGKYDELDTDKTSLSLTLGKSPHDLKRLRIWQALPNPDWNANKQKLLAQRPIHTKPYATALPDRPVHLAMGFRVGEVNQESAIVWTKVTEAPTRNNEGKRVVGQLGPRVILNMKQGARQADKYTPLPTAVRDMEGACPGARGQVRATWSLQDDFSGARSTEWIDVLEADDFTHQFALTNLKPGSRYQLKIEARPSGGEKATAVASGSFGTAADSDAWQDVRFAVVTGQGYKDVDHPQGFHIYEAMRKMPLDFLVATGDSVYYDSERPQARTIELARYHWQRMYSLPRIVELHRSVPGYWEKDDHDTLSDDVFPNKKPIWMLPMTWNDGLRLFREQTPMGKNTFRTIRWGRGLQVWFTENRDFRSDNTDPDGPNKSIWGKQQRQWLMDSILASDADFRVLVSPCPIVGPDRPNKNDNHANEGFFHEGNLFRQWTKQQKLKNFYVCCGDRHWQYLSVDPATGLREFSCGPASDAHASGSPGQDPDVQAYHNVQGGYLSVSVTQEQGRPSIAFRFHGVDGRVDYEYRDRNP
ncbi:MAG: hypothetical protein CMJ48_01430 [Planctomycetaceae bacterium]|nr:hypothetical protein [Planctomycetaceae bacterium]